MHMYGLYHLIRHHCHVFNCSCLTNGMPDLRYVTTALPHLIAYPRHVHRTSPCCCQAGAASAPKQAPTPLSLEQRMGLLGEAPLPSTAGSLRLPGLPASAAPPPVVGVAEGDRARLAAALQSSFTKGSTQDMGSEVPLHVGLRPGGGAASATAATATTAADQPPAPKAPGLLSGAAAAALAGFSSRFTSGSSAETAVLQPQTGGLLQPRAGAGATGEMAKKEAEKPTHTFEDWRPMPLVCKRFNVPDPYQVSGPHFFTFGCNLHLYIHLCCLHISVHTFWPLSCLGVRTCRIVICTACVLWDCRVTCLITHRSNDHDMCSTLSMLQMCQYSAPCNAGLTGSTQARPALCENIHVMRSVTLLIHPSPNGSCGILYV